MMRTSSPVVAVLMGGPSAEHDVSLSSGEAVISALRDEAPFAVLPVVIGRDGVWNIANRPLPAREALAGVSAALLALHGEWGEDGGAQRLLERLRIPYTGSRPLAATAAMHKPTSRAIFREHSLPIPNGHAYASSGGTPDAVALLEEAIHRAHRPPIVVKPAGRGSSVGVSLVRDDTALRDAVAIALRYDSTLLVEEYLNGQEVSCGVLETLDGTPEPLPVALIVPPPTHHFFDYGAKYSGKTQEIVPAPLSPHLVERIQQAAFLAHQALGCRHYSRTDIILVHGIPHILEVNTLPGMTPQSLFPKMAAAAGVPFPKLLEHLVNLALRDNAAPTTNL